MAEVKDINTCDPLKEFYFKNDGQIISGQKISSITHEYNDIYPPLVDRFFNRYYYVKGNADDSYQVLFHSNRVCLIGLAFDHPAFKEGITKINYNIGNLDRSKNEVRGKGKRGGMILQETSTLALITTETGNTYKVPSCIKGKLIEVNTTWSENPTELVSAAEGVSYLAIVLPKPEDCQNIKDSLIPAVMYRDHVLARMAKKEQTDIEGEPSNEKFE